MDEGPDLTGLSYSEKAIYDEIIANLDGYGSDASDMNSSQTSFKNEFLDTHDTNEDPRLCYVMNDHNYMLNSKQCRIAADVRESLIDFVKKNAQPSCSSSADAPIEKLIDSILGVLTKVSDYDSVVEKIEDVFGPLPIKTEAESQEMDELQEAIKEELEECCPLENSNPEKEKTDESASEKEETQVKLETLVKQEQDEINADAENKNKPPDPDDEPMPAVDGIDDLEPIESVPEAKSPTPEELGKYLDFADLPDIGDLFQNDEAAPEVLKDDTEKPEDCDKTLEESITAPEVDDENKVESENVGKDLDQEKESSENEKVDGKDQENAEIIPEVVEEEQKDIDEKQKEDKDSSIDEKGAGYVSGATEEDDKEKPQTDSEENAKDLADELVPKSIEETAADNEENTTETINEAITSDQEMKDADTVNENPETTPDCPVVDEKTDDPETVDKNDPVDESTAELPQLIKELLAFADKLKEDCKSFSQLKDFSPEAFLAQKSKEYKTIISPPTLHTDSSVQTEKIISKKKLRKINAQDKRLLLESSNDSDSSSSSFVDKTLNELDAEYESRKPFFAKYKNSPKRKSSTDSKKSETDYHTDLDTDDDGGKSETSRFDESVCSSSKNDVSDQVGQSSDAEKGKSTAEPSSKTNDKKDQSRAKSTNESDKENRSLVKSPETESSTKSKSDERQDDDLQEKEIDRLLNLKSLADPQKNSPLSNSSKTRKPSIKNASKPDSFYDVMQDMDKNSMSDDSCKEDSEQVLTEKEFLVKCNENLKQQLLNSASSDSEVSNSDEDLIKKIYENSGDEEDEHRLSYVDKFLQTLSDNEDNSPASTDPPKIASPKEEETFMRSDRNEIPLTNDLTTDRNSLGFKKKELSQKTFESIIANDKRQKSVSIQDDPIELSAGSSSSDVEELPAEPKDKSLRIKPMLRQDQLESETIHAQKKEADRLRRLEKRNNNLTKVLKSQSGQVNDNDLVLDYSNVSKKFIKVHPEIVKHLKPHQRDGLKFMYDSTYGCVDTVKESSGSGCILAHCMGLGKTLQIIALLHTVTSYKELKTAKILVLCPKSTIMNWADEFQRWLGPLSVKTLKIFNFSDTADIYEKISVLKQWSLSTAKAGCLIMGYEAFRSLVFYHSHKNRAKSTMRLEEIRTNISKYLLKPGADLVVCDEGHIIKNRKSGISLAAAEIVTPKRIILTGTPIQNNLKEYYAMVNFIKPLILGTEKEFANLYANPIKNGQHKDSSKRDIKVMKQRSFVLHKKLSKFVQRKEAVLLQSFLPQKFEYVLFIPMTDVQNNLYEYVLEAISKREDSRGKSLITDYTCLRKIWSHPKVLEDAWKNAIAAKNKREPPKRPAALAHSDDDQPDDIYDSQTGVISVQSDWWRSLVTETDLESILPSNKLKTMFEIIRMSEENGEKCLIFSAFVAVLNVVEYFFNKINDKQRDLFMFESSNTAGQWINGKDYYRLDGKTNKTLRHEMVKRFNDPKNKRARVFLISAKAGGQGINLIGANRVIILDTSWNPANDQQNIFRIFRLGQKRNCYVYRLIAMGTMEEKVYSRSVTKQAMSFRVVDEQQIDRHYNMAELAELYTLTKPNYTDRPVPIFPQDQILANLLLNSPDLVYKYHEHDSLLENKVEQELSEQEKADAWVAYERDLQMNSEPRENVEGFNGYPLFGQGNYMYPTMGDLDPKNLFAGNPDFSQMDMGRGNVLGSSLLPNYMMNRNSYLDILNMYKNFSSTLMGDKSGRNTHYNPNYGMPLTAGMMNSAAFSSTLPSTENHLPTLANPYYPLHSLASATSGFPSTSLNSHPMKSNPNLPSSNPSSAERYEQSKNLMAAEEILASSMRNYQSSMPTFAKDLLGRTLQPKNLMQSPSPGPSSSPVMHSPTPQNIYSTNIGKDVIPRTVIQRKRGRIPNKPMLTHNVPSVEPAPSISSKSADSLLRPPNMPKTISKPDQTVKSFEQPPIPMPVNMGIVYPKQMSIAGASTDPKEGPCIMKPGSSMQIIPQHSPLTENVRKRFDNISPNISLTAVRTLPKAAPPPSEQINLTKPSQLEITPTSNIRKRRTSLGPDKSNSPSASEQPSCPPPKVAKF